MTAATAPKRPVLRYYGGKWSLGPWIRGFFPLHNIYVEPFGGGASVLMQKAPAPKIDVYNDLDGAIVSLFRVLRDPEQAERLRWLLERTPFARDEFEATYEPPSDDPVENARRMLFRAYAGFGATAFVRNKTGFRSVDKCNGDHAARSWAGWPEQIPLICSRLLGVVIENRPAEWIIEAHDSPATLFYVDPPYPIETRNPRAGRKVRRNGRNRDGDYAHEMSAPDHEALAACLGGVAGMVVLSSYPSARYDEMYAGWERHERGHIANGGRRRREVVWLNPACSRALAESRDQHQLGLAQ